ncbi:MAG: arginine--tRNA ligase [Clostridia bacterium]
MSKLIAQTKESLYNAVTDSINTAIENGLLPKADMPKFTIEVPGDKTHGDYATNIAMAGARVYRMAPAKIAQIIVDEIKTKNTFIEKCEIAGPGFINFYMSPKLNSAIVNDIITLGQSYGTSDFGKGKKILVEFVSANPTGPMHIGNARGGAIGDCLSSVLSATGHEVAREFYVNDAGNQIEKFSTSLEVRYLQKFDPSTEMPEDAYHGQDILVHANNFAEIHGDKFVNESSEIRRKALVDYALPLNIQGLEKDLGTYRIKYDRWFKESSLHQSGAVDTIINLMKSKGHTYEKDGALWFKACEFGNEKDIVLVRANGLPTYIVPDIAYHYDKLITRGYDTAIDVLGADHHGYVARMKAALTALEIDSNRLDIVIMQMVRLVSGGETIKLSKRSGKAITLSTLLEEVPIDSARFIFNMREPNSHCDFDLNLAISEDSQNPVYYVQYAHARICSIIRALKENNITARTCSEDELTLLNKSEEIELISHLSLYTDELIAASKEYDPARITKYVHQTATLFHKFYNACRVQGEDESLMQARLNLCIATKTVISNVLTMFKVSVPEVM